MISGKHVPWHQAPTWARVLNEKMDLLLEGNGNIMSTLADLTTQLNAISVDVTTVGNDVQTLLAKLAAIPPAGLTAAQQAALDAAVATATNIAASLRAIDVTTHPVAPGAMPVLTSISPNTGPATGNTSVTLTGTGFTGATGVSIDNVLTTNMTVVSDTSITATTPAGPAGAQSVIVSTPNGSNVANTLFTYTMSNPVLSSISPTSGVVTGGTVVTLTGSGFTGATGVTIGGVTTAFTVVNDTTITLTTLTGTIVGALPIVVTTPVGVTDGTVMFTFNSGTIPVTGLAPTISSISPASGPVAGGTFVTLTGSGFTGATSVSIGGVSATSFNVVNDTSITATTGAGIVTGLQSVLVTNAVGTNAANALYSYM